MIRLIQLRLCERTERGYVLVTLAITAVVLVLLAGFAVDLGSWYLRASKLQRASDAAALAGAAALPDTAAANAAARDSYRVNGIDPNAANITIDNEVFSDRFVSNVTDNNVPTYFVRMVQSSLSVTRDAVAQKGVSAPRLGSPYNVLGTGNLDIPNVGRQNFWLAINGICSAKEDGDYFSSKLDGNKGPYSTQTEPNNPAIFQQITTPGSQTRHWCEKSRLPGIADNANFDPNGYSYYVDIPPGTVSPVSIMAYKPAMRFYNEPEAGRTYIDDGLNQTGDTYANLNTMFRVWTVANAEDQSDPANTIVNTRFFWVNDSAQPGHDDWATLAVIQPTPELTAAGGTYRVQVQNSTENNNFYSEAHGINAFGLGAFVNGDTNRGCDSRLDASCPRVYGQNAVSVFNSLGDSEGSKVSYYFAEMDQGQAGQTVKLFLFDPAEGVEQLEITDTNGTPLTFSWRDTTVGSTYSGTNVTSIETDGIGPKPSPGLSLQSQAKFNDRLLEVTVTLPNNWGQNTQNPWLKLQYTVGSEPSDRTTWGVTVGQSVSTPPRLVRGS